MTTVGALHLVDLLRPYRRRVRWILMWRWGALGGFVGTLIAILLDALDWLALMMVPTWWLAISVLTGVLLGCLYALVIPLPALALAQLIDRRGQLKDRLQTALEHVEGDHLFDRPLMEDATDALLRMRPGEIFRFRLSLWHGLFTLTLMAMLGFHFLPQILAAVNPERREQQRQVQASAKQIEQVAKPIMERAKKPDATELEKRIARNVELYSRRARQGRMSKQEALLRYNKLLEEARKLEQLNQRKLEQVAQQAATAGEQLKQLAQKNQQLSQLERQLQAELQALQQQLQTGKDTNGNPLRAEQRAHLQDQLRSLQATLQALRNPTSTNLQNQMSELQRQIDELQRQLQSGRDSKGIPLSKEALKALQQQLKRLQQQLRALQLSEQAREFLRKLMNDPNFIEAMRHLQELAKKCQQLGQTQSQQQRQLTQAEIERMARELEKRLEELAKRYSNDEQIRELAKQILEQVKKMKELSQCNGACAGMCLGGMCFGLGATPRPGGAWDKGEYVGQPEMFNQGAKQPELKIPMKNTPVSGQPPLLPGPADYEEYEAPPTPGNSSVPLTQVLPRYQKKAEQALDKQNIPPAERKRVKRYFESLTSGK
ncbi:Chromosome partition protein Smc [bacterium HR15]|nr:Chromosome partition protein Smc [bacterium HR15]